MTEPRKIVISEGFILCPDCKKKLVKVSEDTVMRNVVLYCKRCRKEIKVLRFGGSSIVKN